MKRREFITLLGGATVAWPFAARAQQAERMRRVGVLMNGSPRDAEQQDLVAVLAQTLQQLGWTEGRNFRIDIRWGEGDPRAIRTHAESLVASAPDVIVSTGNAGMPPPLNSEAGRSIGARAQLLLFLDELIPSLFGKPLLSDR